MGWADHVFVLLFVGVYPVVGFFSYRRMKPLLLRAPPGLRRGLYRRNIVAQWVMAAIALQIWLVSDRSVASIGLTLPGGWRLVAGIAAVAVTALFFVLQWQRAKASADVRARVKRQIVGAGELLPRTRGELHAFVAVACTAGFCEELLFRGFLMGYLLALSHSIWIAIAFSSVLFGAGHAYQGAKGTGLTTLAGLAFACVYVITGSLWFSMVIHALVDINAGVLGHMVFGTDDTTKAHGIGAR